MSKPRWLKAGQPEDLPPGGVIELRVLARVVAIFNHEGRLWAVDGLCRHQAAPLALGTFDGSTITCKRHGWRYDLTDGRCLTAGSEWARLRTYEVKVEAGNIFVDVAPIYADLSRQEK